MTEIVERLERQAINVENDGHVSAARAMRDAAAALTEARAEIVSLRTELGETQLVLEQTEKNAAREIERLRGERSILSFENEIRQYSDWWRDERRARKAAESELSTLRARVREVVGPFADAAADLDDADRDATDIWEAPCAMQINVGHLRAARQLNEDLKNA